MTNHLDELAEQYAAAIAEVTDLKDRLPKAQARVKDLRPQLASAIAEAIRTGTRSQVEISRLTGYTPERIRQICRAAGVEPTE